MKAAKKKNEETRPAERNRFSRALDSGETRAIMLAAAFLFVFFYFIRLILLPFVLAAIVAYICTPLLDWAAQRTRWPRLLFAIALFVLILGVGMFVLFFAAEHFVDEVKGLASDLQGMLENFVSQAIGDHPISLLGRPLNAHEIAQSAVEHLRDWLGSEQILLIAGYSLAGIMGLFMTAVLLFYFLAGGRRVMHVEYVPGADYAVRQIRLRPEEYRRLFAAIRADFALDRSGRPVRIDHPGYGCCDSFYRAVGKESAFRTCNSWAARWLRLAGVKTSLWPPFAPGLVWRYRKTDAAT